MEIIKHNHVNSQIDFLPQIKQKNWNSDLLSSKTYLDMKKD